MRPPFLQRCFRKISPSTFARYRLQTTKGTGVLPNFASHEWNWLKVASLFSELMKSTLQQINSGRLFETATIKCPTDPPRYYVWHLICLPIDSVAAFIWAFFISFDSNHLTVLTSVATVLFELIFFKDFLGFWNVVTETTAWRRFDTALIRQLFPIPKMCGLTYF